MAFQKYPSLFITLFVLIFGFRHAAYAQSRPDPINNPSIDALENFIKTRQLLQYTAQKLDSVKTRSLKAGNGLLYARAFYDQMRIRDLRTEDTLYFRNSAFLDTLIDKNNSPKLKALAHLLRAKRLAEFGRRYLRYNAAAYTTADPHHNYALMTPAQRDSLIRADLGAAYEYKADMGPMPQLLWLSSSPDVFLYNAGFRDIVLSEKVNWLTDKGFKAETNPGRYVAWLSPDHEQFKKRLYAVVPKDGTIAGILGAYREWLALQQEEGRAVFIASLARKFLFRVNRSDTVAIKSYLSYLEKNSASTYPELKAHAVYQLCLLWNSDGYKYLNKYDSYRYRPNKRSFDPQYQYLPAKALSLLDQNRKLMQRYPLFYDVLDAMSRQILAKGLRVELEDKQLPQQPIRFMAVYHNTDTLCYRIVRSAYGDSLNRDKDKRMQQLLAGAVAAEGVFALPLPADHNSHRVYLKLPALPAGRYYLLFGSKVIGSANDLPQVIPFDVTGIAAVNTDERIFVLDRKTGFPLAGAKIKAYKKKVTVFAGIPSATNARGIVSIPENLADSITIIHKADTTGYKFYNEAVIRPDGAFDKEDDDSLDEFYDEHATMQIFTDRAIYRPGQTVHYKVILMNNNKRTGEKMLFNKANLGGGLFKNRVKKWLSYADHSKIYLRDQFNHIIDSVTISVNDFGSFAGSFTLSKTAATGSWEFVTDADVDYPNDGSFKVEEYKRPTLDLTMEKQTKMLLPGQPFNITLKLKSFSGAQINGTSVKYTIKRNGHTVYDEYYSGDYGNYNDTLLISGSAVTDRDGLVSIPVNDTSLSRLAALQKRDWEHHYVILANATDATGETVDLKADIDLSSHPLRINIEPLDKTYDRQQLPLIRISTVNEFEGDMGRMVNLKIYKTADPKAPIAEIDRADQWYYSKTDWSTWFPEMSVRHNDKVEKTLVLDTMINTALFEKLRLPKGRLGVGFYRVEATCEDNGIVIGRRSMELNLFDSATGETPVDEFDHLPFNSVMPGALVPLYSSGRDTNYTIYHIAYRSRTKKQVIQYEYQERTEAPGLRKWEYRVPKDAVGTITVSRISIINNKLLKTSRWVYVDEMYTSPEIIVERYKKVMAPGAKQTFTLSFKTKDVNTAAEIMTTMYDATLDKLEKHKWEVLEERRRDRDIYVRWNKFITGDLTAGGDVEMPHPVVMPGLVLTNSSDFGFDSGSPGNASSIIVAAGLKEVVVSTVSTTRYQTTGSVTTITRGNAGIGIEAYKQPLVILDGVAFTGDLKDIKLESITEGLIFKGQEATALYGSEAAKGVLVLSTKGPIKLPKPPEPVVKVRKDFNETAFFYPQVHAGKDGLFSFDFTMPETATEWNWKMMAHTRNAQFVYLEKKIQTQLNLMVQPNMPRLLYQGDKILLQSRISNLDTTSIKGKATCKIEDAVTGEDITAGMVAQSDLSFEVGTKSVKAVSFQLQVPADLLNPIKIVVTATTANAADAEEHIIPVLSPRVFVKQSLPVRFDARLSLNIPAIKLPAVAELYGVGLSITQKPASSLIYALPWLANYTYDCAEQTFNKLRANFTAINLMRTDTGVQKAYQKAMLAVQTNKTDDATTSAEKNRAAMPWLNLGDRTAERQEKLFRLLDTAETKFTILDQLTRLKKLQTDDGGIAWFDGGQSDPYISAYVLAGFGQLPPNFAFIVKDRSKDHQDFMQKLIAYNEAGLRSTGDGQNLYRAYALSYCKAQPMLFSRIAPLVRAVAEAKWQDINKLSLQQQALLIITTLRFVNSNDQFYQKAMAQLGNIKQLAIVDDANGMRWKEIADNDDVNHSDEETMALIAEAFEAGGNAKDVHAGIAKWLLSAKQGEHWQNTKATAAAIDLLQKEHNTTFGDDRSFLADVNGKKLSVSDGLLNGAPEAFTRTVSAPASIDLKQQGRNTTGALSWYYFTDADHLDTLNKAVRVTKQFYVYRDKWVPIEPVGKLKIGDKIQVRLKLEAASKLTFVHITDPRAAAFEPAETNSGYERAPGFSYYRSVKDTGLDIFAEQIARGITEIVYEVVVAHGGEFSSGPAQLECMYAPAITAYSKATKFRTE